MSLQLCTRLPLSPPALGTMSTMWEDEIGTCYTCAKETRGSQYVHDTHVDSG
jgi:hypothetical protein